MARVLMIAYTGYVHDGRVKRHARALAERGDRIDLICLQNSEEGEHNGVNVIGLKVPRYRGNSKAGYFRVYLRFFMLAASHALRLELKHHYDVVIVCTMPDVAILCALPLKLLGSKIVLDIHDTMPELYKDKFGGTRGALGARVLGLLERASTWPANRVLAVHDLHRSRLERAGVKAEKISVVLNVPDHQKFEAAFRAPASSAEFNVMCHGTVAKRLGLEVAIHAMGLLRDRVPNARLLVAGIGDHLPACKRIAADLGVEDRVSFLKPVPFEQLPLLLSQASVGLVPYRASSATHLMLPVKLLEYAMFGIPVIASRLRTIEHYFDESAISFFEPGNPASLAAAIERLYSFPELRRSLAERARQTMDTLDWRFQRDHYYGAIDSLLQNRLKSAARAIGRDGTADSAQQH